MSVAKAKHHMKKSAEHAKMAHAEMEGASDTKKGKVEAKSEKAKGGMEKMGSKGCK